MSAAKLAGLTPEQVAVVFSEIATLAISASTLTSMLISGASDDVHARDALTHSLQTIINTIGYLADMPTDGECRGGAAEWFLPPSCLPTRSAT